MRHRPILPITHLVLRAVLLLVNVSLVLLWGATASSSAVVSERRVAALCTGVGAACGDAGGAQRPLRQFDLDLVADSNNVIPQRVR